MNKEKKVVAVVYGGNSVEHEISLMSAESVIANIDKEQFEIFPVYITKSGIWRRGSLQNLNKLKDTAENSNKHLAPSLEDNHLPTFYEIEDNQIVNSHRVDLIFPVLHGSHGEDGVVQGLFELMGAPYVGASVMGSSVGMDKIVMKVLLRDAGLPVVDFVGFTMSQWKKEKKDILDRILRDIKTPCFVKSADLGSSVGITKISSESEDEKNIESAIEFSGKFSNRIIVEKAVGSCREFEVSVLGNDEPVASQLGEIIPKREFYDYKAKYEDAATDLIIPAEIDQILAEKMRTYAAETFKALSCSGMGRVDFLMDGTSGEIFISEINTIPGFTTISMYPKLWEASGVKYPELTKRVIELAFEKFEKDKKLKRSLV